MFDQPGDEFGAGAPPMQRAKASSLRDHSPESVMDLGLQQRDRLRVVAVCNELA